MRGFGELEAAIMDRPWSAGQPLLARDAQKTLTSGRACNTVLTLAEILYRKGWLARDPDGRAYRCRAVVSREDRTAGLIGEVLAGGTDPAATLRRFAEQTGPDEAQQLREALDQPRQAAERR